MTTVEKLRADLECAQKRAKRLREELAAERACRDRLVEVMSDLIALFGTSECRLYSVFQDAINAMAVAVTLGYNGPITLAHADDVHQAAAAIEAGRKA